MYVNTPQKLQQLCEQLRGVERFALDTEFMSERSYVPTLEIIQIAAPVVEAIIDYQAVRRLDCFFDLLADPGIEKILHAGSQDLEIFYRLSGRVPTPIFDTQVAAALLGYGAQPGYGALVEQLTGARLEKSETLTDWSRRPLTQAQIEYALDDVRYLLEMHRKLVDQLHEKGRLSWVEDEFARMAAPETYDRLPVEEMWRRVRGAAGLRPRQLAILRELAAWREEEARRRDRPRGAIARDDLLVGIARKAPTRVEELRQLRGLHPREIERAGGAIIAAVRRGQQTPRDQIPDFPSAALPLSGQESALLEMLQALVRARADESGVAPTLIATNSELEELIQRRSQSDIDELPLLRGWRRELAGEDLLRIIRGEAEVGWDRKRNQLRLSYTEDGRA